MHRKEEEYCERNFHKVSFSPGAITELHPKYWTDSRHLGDRLHLFTINGWWEAAQAQFNPFGVVVRQVSDPINIWNADDVVSLLQ